MLTIAPPAAAPHIQAVESLIDTKSTKALAVVNGRVVPVSELGSARSMQDSYYTSRPVIGPCPYFG